MAALDHPRSIWWQVRALSLFSGAGGADLGITEAGIEVVRGVEHDADAVKTCHAAVLATWSRETCGI